MKELDLGRDLLNKAVTKISAEHIKEIHEAKGLSLEDKDLISVMHGLVEVAADPATNGDFSWDQTNTALGENPYRLLHNLKTFSENVQKQNLSGPKVKHLKDKFILASQSTQLTERYTEAVREFLCEGFCLIDIIEEIQLSQSPDKRA